jgi:hypothetical protein
LIKWCAHTSMHPQMFRHLLVPRRSYRPSKDSRLVTLRARTLYRNGSRDSYIGALKSVLRMCLTQISACSTSHQYLPPAWKHAHLVSILKQGKETSLSFFSQTHKYT